MVKSNLVQPRLTPENQDRRGQWRNNKIMIIQNMAYDQQIQKPKTENSNILNPKTN